MPGRKVQTLVNQHQPAGSYSVTFDAAGFSNGIYYYQLKVDDVFLDKKIMLLLQ